MLGLRSTLLLLVALVLALTFAMPVDDVAETKFDESESLPLSVTPRPSSTAAMTISSGRRWRNYATTVGLDEQSQEEIFAAGRFSFETQSSSQAVFDCVLRC